MNLTRLTDARSLAAIARIEADRARWLRTFASVPEEQRALTNCWYDQQSSGALTQGLADAACEEVRAATARQGP